MPKLAPDQRTPTDKTARPSKLSERERRFVEAFMGAAAGNASEAARLAGYAASCAGRTAVRLTQKDTIKAAIAERQASDPLIATRDEVQRKVSRTLRGDEGQLGLRASELLCRMNGWLVDRQEHTGKDGGPIKVEERQVIHQHFPAGLPANA